jgi:hypothetical protein
MPNAECNAEGRQEQEENIPEDKRPENRPQIFPPWDLPVILMKHSTDKEEQRHVKGIEIGPYCHVFSRNQMSENDKIHCQQTRIIEKWQPFVG